MRVSKKKGRELWYPRKGDAENLFKRLAEYISKFDTEWVKNIRPASKEKIEFLIEKSEIREFHQTIPKEYQVYLEHMGEEDGGLFEYLYGLGSTNIDKIIRRYKPDPFDNLELKRKRPPYIIFFLSALGLEISIDLRGEPPYKIVRTGEFEIGDIMAESFEKVLFQSAFREFEGYGNPYYFVFYTATIKIEIALQEQRIENIFKFLDGIRKKYRLEKAWFSDFKHYIALGRKVSFYINYLISSSSEETRNCHVMEVRITGKNRKCVKRIGDILMKEFGGRIDEYSYHM